MSNAFHFFQGEEQAMPFPVIQSLLSVKALMSEVLSDYDILTLHFFLIYHCEPSNQFLLTGQTIGDIFSNSLIP
jgi:hypothetical protein